MFLLKKEAEEWIRGERYRREEEKEREGEKKKPHVATTFSKKLGAFT